MKEGLTTNGTEFVFALPQLFGSLVQIGLHVMSFVGSNQLETKFFVDTGYVQEDTHLLTKTESYINLGSNYDSPVANGLRPSIYAVALAPVHLMLALTTSTNSALIKLLPKSEWGTAYYVVTMKMSPTILITSSEDDNEIEIQLKISEPHLAVIGGKPGKENQKIQYLLKRLYVWPQRATRERAQLTWRPSVAVMGYKSCVNCQTCNSRVKSDDPVK
ncbi:hypothetical protein Btru_017638 [Bulinus truncatus]|nr:hypothetical protein Btru_017638 [Bulinus truncatus]